MRPIKYDSKKQKIIFTDAERIFTGDIESKPEVEQKLFLMQDSYYTEKDEGRKREIWSNMFMVVQKYSRSLVLKKIKGGRRYVEPSEIDDYATQTALSFMVQYVQRPGFWVGASFAGMINPKVLETLYKYCDDDQNYSLNGALGDSSLELKDFKEQLRLKPIHNKEEVKGPDAFIGKTSLKETLYPLLREFYSETDDDLLRFKMLAYAQILLRRPKNKHVKPMFFRHVAKTKKEYDLFHLFEYELRKRLK